MTSKLFDPEFYINIKANYLTLTNNWLLRYLINFVQITTILPVLVLAFLQSFLEHFSILMFRNSFLGLLRIKKKFGNNSRLIGFLIFTGLLITCFFASIFFLGHAMRKKMIWEYL